MTACKIDVYKASPGGRDDPVPWAAACYTHEEDERFATWTEALTAATLHLWQHSKPVPRHAMSRRRQEQLDRWLDDHDLPPKPARRALIEETAA